MWWAGVPDEVDSLGISDLLVLLRQEFGCRGIQSEHDAMDMGKNFDLQWLARSSSICDELPLGARGLENPNAVFMAKIDDYAVETIPTT